MTVDAAKFRTDFPAFASVATYPDASVNFWLTLGYALLRPERWVDLIDQGVELFVAHNLTLEKLAAGGNPSGAIVNSKQVDKLSVGYDTSAGLIPDAGNFNLTTYGTRFFFLMNMAGMGGTQLGAGAAGFAPGVVAIIVGGPLGPGWPHGY